MQNFNLEEISLITDIIRVIFIGLGTLYTITKLTNEKDFTKIQKMLMLIITLISSSVTAIISNVADDLSGIICFIILLSTLYSSITKKSIGYTILTSTISLSINYIMFFIAVIINFIFNNFINVNNDYINLIIIIVIYLLLTYVLFKIKKFKYGFYFLRDENLNEHFEILILNISIILILLFIVLTNFEMNLKRSTFFAIISISVIMFINIHKLIQLNYKQKLLIQDLTETKKELQSKNKRIQELEKENLKISKTNHSINHKQESLEHKLDELMLKTEISSELTIKDQINQISNQLTNKIATPELPKTNIEQIDDMLKYMQSECTKNKIEFNLQIKGNIYQMTNNYIPKEDLEILLADHIRNAIIAINHSNNVNRSILVRLGKLDGTYSLYIYDSGIEFEVSTLTTLGITPSTTHKDKGGTGMGFMNTFDTLNKTKSSIIINEYNKPTKENYTKSIMIKCDNKNEYKIFSYRAKEIEKTDPNNRLILIDTSKKEI